MVFNNQDLIDAIIASSTEMSNLSQFTLDVIV